MDYCVFFSVVCFLFCVCCVVLFLLCYCWSFGLLSSCFFEDGKDWENRRQLEMQNGLEMFSDMDQHLMMPENHMDHVGVPSLAA